MTTRPIDWSGLAREAMSPADLAALEARIRALQGKLGIGDGAGWVHGWWDDPPRPGLGEAEDGEE
jgi:hypothetical protein